MPKTSPQGPYEKALDVVLAGPVQKLMNAVVAYHGPHEALAALGESLERLSARPLLRDEDDAKGSHAEGLKFLRAGMAIRFIAEPFKPAPDTDQTDQT